MKEGKSILNTISRIRNFLFGIINKEFLVFLFFLVLSGVFWLLMTLNETYEKELKIPLRLVNVPKNAIITTGLPDTARVVVRDKGYSFIAYYYGNRIHPIYVNFYNFANTNNGHGSVPVAEVQKLIYQQLFGSSRITSYKSDKLEFFFNYGRSKVLPVRLSGKVDPGQSRYLSRIQFAPERVTVYANKSKLDSLKCVYTENLNIENFEDTVVRNVRLRKEKGVKFDPAQVVVTFYSDVLTEESVVVPIVAINLPKGKILRMFPARVKVNFTVGARMFKKINANQFKVVVDYNDVASHPSDKCNLYLKTYPQGVFKARLEVDQVDYLVEQQ